MLVLGNIFAFVGQAVNAASGLIKSRMRTLIAQIVAMLIMACGNAALGGFTGAALNLVGCVRNLLWYHGRGSTGAKVVFGIVMAGAAWATRGHGLLWLLPLASNIAYLIGLDLEGWRFKALLVFTTVLWIPYDWAICNYAALAFDCLGLCTNAFTAYRLKRAGDDAPR